MCMCLEREKRWREKSLCVGVCGVFVIVSVEVCVYGVCGSRCVWYVSGNVIVCAWYVIEREQRELANHLVLFQVMGRLMTSPSSLTLSSSEE